LPLEHKNFIPSIVCSKARDISGDRSPKVGGFTNYGFPKGKKNLILNYFLILPYIFLK
jgi:hypothetical protein